ncbi:hypothetical protein SLS56_004636 [Neofusicoccum ribis]|uniref:Uncharacterized protein n=1 Tax=Neofusicoccum ribis TaxID=45134 RepID=A0ABR3SWD7_9PEZI
MAAYVARNSCTNMNAVAMSSSNTQYIYITNLRGGQAIRADPNLFLPDDDDDEQPTIRPLNPPRTSSVSSASSTSSRLSSAEPSSEEE